MSTPFTVCVYCGSRNGDDPAYLEAAKEVGRQIGERGWRLVYGGGSTGLMGAAADGALEAGAQVIGIIPERLVKHELAHSKVTTLEVVDTMHTRKHHMAMYSDAFIALPGGIGTMEEIFEVWTWRQLGYHRKALGLLNVNGFYDDLLRFIESCRDKNFLWPDVHDLLLVDTQIASILDRLHEESQRLKAESPAEPIKAPGGIEPGI